MNLKEEEIRLKLIDIKNQYLKEVEKDRKNNLELIKSIKEKLKGDVYWNSEKEDILYKSLYDAFWYNLIYFQPFLLREEKNKIITIDDVNFWLSTFKIEEVFNTILVSSTEINSSETKEKFKIIHEKLNRANKENENEIFFLNRNWILYWDSEREPVEDFDLFFRCFKISVVGENDWLIERNLHFWLLDILRNYLGKEVRMVQNDLKLFLDRKISLENLIGNSI